MTTMVISSLGTTEADLVLGLDLVLVLGLVLDHTSVGADSVLALVLVLVQVTTRVAGVIIMEELNLFRHAQISELRAMVEVITATAARVTGTITMG